MKRIEPTHIEIMKNLNCVHHGYLGRHKCVCTSPHMFKGCYEIEKERLTKIEYTEEEIQEQIAQNATAMNKLEKSINELFN